MFSLCFAALFRFCNALSAWLSFILLELYLVLFVCGSHCVLGILQLFRSDACERWILYKFAAFSATYEMYAWESTFNVLFRKINFLCLVFTLFS